MDRRYARAALRSAVIVILAVASACGSGADAELGSQAEASTAQEPAVFQGFEDMERPPLCIPWTVDQTALILSNRPALARAQIHLRRVLATFASQTSDPSDTAESLYARMLHVFRSSPGITLDDWYGVALVNRFDLAPPDGRTCGEYRLVVSRRRGGTVVLENSRFTVIFEALVPNPSPRRGLAGCRPLQEAWAALSSMQDDDARAQALAAMFFDGVAGFPPLVHIGHYGNAGGGQVRANFFLNADVGPWILDEFALVNVPVDGSDVDRDSKTVALEDRPVADTLGVNIMEAGPATTRVVATLRDDFISQLDALAAAPDQIRYRVPTPYLASDSRASVNPASEGWVSAFTAAGGDSSHFGLQLAGAMEKRGITGITPTQMVRRMVTQSCGGCHDDARASIGGGATWPKNMPDGRVFIIDPDGNMSGALTAFLPGRIENLRRFLSCGLE